MKSRIDQIFADKLRGFNKKPSDEAWTKINNNLNAGKKSKFNLIKIAASIILIVTTGFLVYSIVNNNQNNTVDQLSNSETNEIYKPGNEDTQKGISNNTNNDQLAEKEENNEEIKPDHTEKNNIRTQIKNNNLAENDQQLIEKDAFKTASQLKSIKKIALAESPVFKTLKRPLTTNIIHKDASKATVAVTITYKRSDRSSESSGEVLALNNQKEKGLKKLIDFAKEVKNGDIGLSDIREAKDDLLATDINFKKLSIIQKEKTN